MKQELQNQLFADFPDLFCHCRYIDCENGWYGLIHELSHKITEQLTKENIKERITFATQVKEKYGGLRFYVSCASDAVFKLIDEYESRSNRTCEVCGEPGILTDDGWIKTLCQKHRQ